MENPEIGKEYTLEELLELELPQVVCLKREDHPFWITTWLVVASRLIVVFKSMDVIFLTRPAGGRLTDDSNKTLTVAEYLGEE